MIEDSQMMHFELIASFFANRDGLMIENEAAPPFDGLPDHFSVVFGNEKRVCLID